MIRNASLAARALDRYGFILRVSDAQEYDLGSAGFIDDDTTSATATTHTPTARYEVTPLPAGTRPGAAARVPYEHPIDVYLDGAYLRTGGWLRDHEDPWPDAWILSVRTPADLEIIVRTASEPTALPAELALVRDKPTSTRL